MQLIRPLLVFAWLGFGFIYWLLGYPGVAGSLIGFALFWLTLGLGYGYWVGLSPETDKMVHDLMVWISEKKSQRKRQSQASDERAE